MEIQADQEVTLMPNSTPKTGNKKMRKIGTYLEELPDVMMVVPKMSQAKYQPVGPDEVKAYKATPSRVPRVESQDETMEQDDPIKDEPTTVSSPGQDQH
jgi:hypothetical protein